MLSAKNGHVECVREVLKLGATKEMTNKDLDTALTIACMEAHCGVLNVLLAAGDSPNFKNAVWKSNPEIVRINALINAHLLT